MEPQASTAPAPSLGKVVGVLEVIGTGVAADLDVTLNQNARNPKERDRSVRAYPVATFFAGKIAILDPLRTVLGVSPSCPFGQTRAKLPSVAI